MNRPLSSMLFILATCLLFGANVSYAHDVVYDLQFSDFSSQQVQHDDLDPFKGSIELSATNTGTDPWGDFHFEIYEVPGYSIENVFFTSEDPKGSPGNEDWAPTVNLTDYSWRISPDGHLLDFEFYSNPVYTGETIDFLVYTDNTTDQVSFFGQMFYPTPVPVPGAVWLLGAGLVGLIGLRKKG